MLFTRQALRSRAAVLTVAALLAAIAVGGCDADDDADKPAADGPGVVAPGKPGEPARTLTAEEAAGEIVENTPNSADHRYVQMMIEHHEQALVMTALAPDRASSASVKSVAARISAGQQPEIGAMRGWQKNHDARDEVRHDHTAMPGLATAARLDELRAARGEEFDRLFLTLMIAHHQGAVTMATDVLSEGNDVLVEEMATDVAAQQTVEVDRMRALLD